MELLSLRLPLDLGQEPIHQQAVATAFPLDLLRQPQVRAEMCLQVRPLLTAVAESLAAKVGVTCVRTGSVEAQQRRARQQRAWQLRRKPSSPVTLVPVRRDRGTLRVLLARARARAKRARP